MSDGCATLYVFKRPDGQRVCVVRVTDTLKEDWMDWPERHKTDHPDIGDLECIASVEFVDERP